MATKNVVIYISTPMWIDRKRVQDRLGASLNFYWLLLSKYTKIPKWIVIPLIIIRIIYSIYGQHK